LTYAKWRRGILIFYGCAGLISCAAYGAYSFVKNGTSTIASTAPQSSTVAARTRQP
jgi:hypothetical protein